MNTRASAEKFEDAPTRRCIGRGSKVFRPDHAWSGGGGQRLAMTVTLDGVTTKKPDAFAEAEAARELVRRPRSRAVADCLDRLPSSSTKT